MIARRVIVVGGGAAGFFAAITCAEASPEIEIILLEKGPQFLSKVRISGGGRCNVTHGSFNVREFAARFAWGEAENGRGRTDVSGHGFFADDYRLFGGRGKKSGCEVSDGEGS